MDSGSAPKAQSAGLEKVFHEVFERWLDQAAVDRNIPVLLIGASAADVDRLLARGFVNITVSNVDALSPEATTSAVRELPFIKLDVEDMSLADNSFDMVFCHEVIHHCRSPHMALCEMMRVARRYVVVMEPNDSFCIRTLVRLGMSHPYEVPAVVDNDFVRGGVRNTHVPNFIYRWTVNEFAKTAATFCAETTPNIFAFPYWEFSVDERAIEARKMTKLSVLTRLIGAANFIRLIKAAGWIFNRLGILRRQGNKIFCAIDLDQPLHPWLNRDGEKTVFNRDFLGKGEH